jgi:hypothetical protein
MTEIGTYKGKKIFSDNGILYAIDSKGNSELID